MGIIREEIEILGTRKSKKIVAMFDSGAFSNYMRTRLSDGDNPDSIGFVIFEGKHDAILANGDIASGEKIRFNEMRIKGCIAKEPSFVILETLLEEVIIGAELMQKLGITLDPPNEKICVSVKSQSDR